MEKADSIYIKGSVINNIAFQNLRFLRQRASDKEWDKQAEKLAFERSKTEKKRRAARPGYVRKPSKVLVEQIKNQNIQKYLTVSGISSEWTPKNELPPPEFPGSQEKFALAAGIDLGHFIQLEKGKVDFTLDDAVKIARVGNIDIGTFLTPSVNSLESDLFIDVMPIHPARGPVRMYEWLMWIRGFRALPGQDRMDYEELTVLPMPFIESPVDSKVKRAMEERNAELNRVWESKVSVKKYMEAGFPLDADQHKSNPFSSVISTITFDSKVSWSLIKRINLLSLQIKRLSRGHFAKNKKRFARDAWSEDMKRLRYMVSGIVWALLGLEKK